MTIEIQGLDTEKGLDLYDDEIDIYVTVLRSFADNVPKVLGRLREMAANAPDINLADYAAFAHGIKGTSSNIGAEDIRKEALELELLAKAGDMSAVLAKNEMFLKHADSLIANIKNFLEQYGAG